MFVVASDQELLSRFYVSTPDLHSRTPWLCGRQDAEEY